MNKFLSLLTLLIFIVSAGIAQNPGAESRILRKYKIKERKTYCSLLNKEGKDSIHFLVFSIKYNDAGYPISQIRLKEDGTISDKFISAYQSDSLEIKRTGYGSGNEISSELIFTYNKNGKLIVRRSTDKIKGVDRKQFYEFDSSKHISKDYGSSEEEKFLTGIHEYDKNWKKIKDTYYNKNGEVFNTFLSEYDSLNGLIKIFSLRSGVKTLHTEKKYSIDNLLIAETNYYNSAVKLWDFNGMVESYKKGDKKEVKYLYDERGLLSEQTELLNNKLVLKITYEYL